MQVKSISRPQTASYSNISNLKNSSASVSIAVSKAPPKDKKNVERPEWNGTLSDNPHKLSHAEILRRKLNARSKNEGVAR